MKLILASSSPRRRALLEQFRVPVEVFHSNVDESVSEKLAPNLLVKTLAKRKALAVLSQLSGNAEDVVIGADTVVTIDGAILGKPKDKKDAANMLRLLQGRTHRVYTGLCVAGGTEKRVLQGCSATDVTMEPLAPEDIENYLATGEPFDKAGSYGIQGYGSLFIREIVGDYFTVVGLPLFLLEKFLKEFGVSLMTLRCPL